MKQREIKFRIFNFVKNRMISWGKILNEKPHKRHYRNYLWLLVETNVWKVMQYTGLKDKNGKEIYERDILGYWGSAYSAYWVVLWDEKHGRWMFGKNNIGVFGFTKSSCKGKEIIGNIYENPELLKEK